VKGSRVGAFRNWEGQGGGHNQQHTLRWMPGRPTCWPKEADSRVLGRSLCCGAAACMPMSLALAASHLLTRYIAHLLDTPLPAARRWPPAPGTASSSTTTERPPGAAAPAQCLLVQQAWQSCYLRAWLARQLPAVTTGASCLAALLPLAAASTPHTTLSAFRSLLLLPLLYAPPCFLLPPLAAALWLTAPTTTY